MAGSTSDGRRDLSVVVFGATGIAGRNVAVYLAERAEEDGFSWAAAGRDPAKIERVLGEIGVSAPETIAADCADSASLAEMAARARVVLDLVGPYTLYGRPVIEACVAAGTHYADLTGEVPFVRATIDDFHERAKEAGVKIVQVAGYESLPPDLCVLLAAETARERWDEELAEVEVEAEVRQPPGRLGFSDLLSGGTLQGFPAMLDGPGAERAADPAALVSDPELAAEIRRRSPIGLMPRRNARGDVLAPLTPSAFLNPLVVQRTAALLAAERGASPKPFSYREGMVIAGSSATLPLRFAAAGGMAAVQAGVAASMHLPSSVRSRLAAGLRTALPSSGFGPTGSRLEDWTWRLSVDAATTGGRRVRVELDADGQPGYLTTSRMLGEAGLMLAEEGATPGRAGCLTPAAALGTGGVERFERAGMRFSVVS